MAIITRELNRTDWKVIEALFGERGACGGCWCMAWRSQFAGKVYKERQGAQNRSDFHRLIVAGRVHGALALERDVPVGWCSVGPRADFPALRRSRVLRTEWDESTWSVTCFFIPRRERGRGIGRALLSESVAVAKRHGASRLEGYPVRVGPGKTLPGPFVWTGLPSMFEAAGFTLITPPDARPIYELALR